MSRLLEKYKTKILPNLKASLGRENVHSIPRITKVVISMGLGKALADRKRVEEAVDHLRTIAGQKPQVTKSRIAVSGFRLREGVDVGCKVTLRGTRMYDFIDRLITLALPRVRDFRGVRSTGFDGNGNFSMGLNEQTVFPEIDPDRVTYVQGMNIAIVTTATSDAEGLMLLREIGIPFAKEQSA
jgi:large subunit ribosomal protein L5